MKDVSGLLLMIGVLLIVDTLCGESDCRNKRPLPAADDDDDKLLCEESVGEVWFELRELVADC